MEMLGLRIAATAAGVLLVGWMAWDQKRRNGMLQPEQWFLGGVLLVVLVVNPWAH